jgi:hypothetical protein
VDQQPDAHLTKYGQGLLGPFGRIGGNPDVQGLARPDRRVQRAHGLLERGVRVETVGVEDVDVLQAHPAQRLVEAGQQVLAGAVVAVRTGPHVVAGLGRDDQLIAVRPQVFPHDPAEINFGCAVWRPVIVRQVEVRDAQVERPADDRALVLDRLAVAEILPQPERNLGQQDPAAPAAAVGVLGVTVLGGHVCHGGQSFIRGRPPVSRRVPVIVHKGEEPRCART